MKPQPPCPIALLQSQESKERLQAELDSADLQLKACKQQLASGESALQASQGQASQLAVQVQQLSQQCAQLEEHCQQLLSKRLQDLGSPSPTPSVSLEYQLEGSRLQCCQRAGVSIIWI